MPVGDSTPTTTLREEVTAMKLSTAVQLERLTQQVMALAEDSKDRTARLEGNIGKLEHNLSEGLSKVSHWTTGLALLMLLVGMVSFAALMLSLDNRYRIEQQRYQPGQTQGVLRGQ